MNRPNCSLLAFAALVLALPAGAGAQTFHRAEDIAVRLTSMTAISGYEDVMALELQSLLDVVRKDRAGNVVMTLGSGEPRRLVACAMDEFGYVVGGIRDDGWLTLRTVGRAPWLFHQNHEGRRVTVWTDVQPMAGVMALPSAHLNRRGTLAETAFTSDEGYVDIGARDGDHARSLGVELMDPIAIEKSPVLYGDSLLAAPEAGQRGGCAALARAAMNHPAADGTVVVAFTTESRLGHGGLFTLANLNGPFREALLVGYPEFEGGPEGLGAVERMSLETRHGGWQVETISLREVRTLSEAIETWMTGGDR